MLKIKTLKIKTPKVKEIVPIILIFVMIITAFSLFEVPCLPDKLPSHWNAAGEVDGYSGKTFALFFYPALTLFVYILMLVLPKIDPFRKNYAKFKKPYYFIRLLLVVFFFALYFYMIFTAIGSSFDIRYFMIPILSLLFLGLGFAMPKIKRNYFIGFRTPWTLQSEEVWEKTHKFGGKIFMAAAVVGFFGIFFESYGFWIFMTAIIAGALIPFGYSYFVYKKLGLFRSKS